MAKHSVEEISKIVGGTLHGNGGDEDIKYLLTNSRALVSPANTLFFAIEGTRHDGHNFISELYEKQVRNFIVSKLPSIDRFPEANFIFVDDTLKALQDIGKYHRAQFDIPVIGITGSNGKTIVKEWIFQLLRFEKNIVRSPKSYNSQIGVPLSVWILNEKTDIGIFEAGISQPGEMNKLQKIIKPTIGIFTNIGDAHQENFIDYKHKISEKLKLFTDCETLIYCKDDSLIERELQAQHQFEKVNLFSWSKKSSADLFISGVKKAKTETLIKGKNKNKNIEITIPFTDDGYIENAIHCWALMLHLNYDNADISKRMKLLMSIAMRLELKEGNNNCTIINDSYNSDLGSLGIALDFLNQQQQHDKKTLVLSDILQSGRDDSSLYTEVADLINKKNLHQIIGVGPAISRHADLFNIQKRFFSSTDELLQHISELKLQNEVVLLKGARNFEFERISNVLQQKVHETVLEINLNALVENLNYYKSKLKPGVKVMAMVKAFSYGSGVVEIANVLQYQRLDYLAVAFADEGVQLRKAGINLPIMVMNPEVQSYDLMIEHHLEPEIYSFRVLKLFYEAVNRNRINSFPIHIKLDTGMKRLGFAENEIPTLIEELKKRPQLPIKSVFTHLAATDEDVHDSFTQTQLNKFELMSKEVVNAFDYPIMRHTLNSSGIERFPSAQYDMVRLGIGMYGISATAQNMLVNVSTLKTIISQIKKVPLGETVGYSRKGKFEKESTIAILPIGYADGLSRQLGNGVGKVLINGQFVPIIGNVCMDMCMVDVSDVEAEEGDEVILFGDDYHVSEIANQLGTIPYEIMTSISQRVKRVYFQE